MGIISTILTIIIMGIGLIFSYALCVISSRYSEEEERKLENEKFNKKDKRQWNIYILEIDNNCNYFINII